MLDLNEAYGEVLTSPSEPSRGASARLVHEEVERTRVAALAAPAVVALPPVQQVHYKMKADDPPKGGAVNDGARGRDVKKLVLYALVVTLGLSIHYVCSDWLTKYISTAYLSENSEQLAKLCYPACIVATLWIIRAWK